MFNLSEFSTMGQDSWSEVSTIAPNPGEQERGEGGGYLYVGLYQLPGRDGWRVGMITVHCICNKMKESLQASS